MKGARRAEVQRRRTPPPSGDGAAGPPSFVILALWWLTRGTNVGTHDKRPRWRPSRVALAPEADR